MSEPLHVAPRPCTTCPYRKDTPPGLWAASEYERLAEFDGHGNIGHVFLCHQTHATGVDTACKGWLWVHQDDASVRVAQLAGKVTPEQVAADPQVPLYASGAEARDAGLAGVERPSAAARRAMSKLRRTGVVP